MRLVSNLNWEWDFWDVKDHYAAFEKYNAHLPWIIDEVYEEASPLKILELL